MTQSLAEFRKDKDEAFRNEGWSPLTGEQKANFQGLDYYSENPKLVFQNVIIEPAGADKTVDIPTSAGDFEKYLRAGIISLAIDGKTYQLNVYKDIDGDNYFLPIKDTTSGNETYKDGRYVDIEVEDNKIARIDFNYAYNPYCAYNYNWRCPITPEENRLPIAIDAGEKILMASNNKKHKIIFYGANWCGDCHRSKQLLDELGVDYEYIDIEKDPEAAKKVVEINKGYQSIPTIIFPDSHILVEPSNEELKKEIEHLLEKNLVIIHKQ